MKKIYQPILLTISVMLSLTIICNSVRAQTRTTNSDTDITNAAGFDPNGFNAGDDLLFGGAHTVTISTDPFPLPNLVNFNIEGATLKVQTGIVLSSSFKSDVGSGAIIVDGNSIIGLTGVFETDINTRVRQLVIKNGSQVNLTTNLYLMNDAGISINLDSGGILNINPEKVPTIFNIEAADISATSDGKGVINIFGESEIKATIGRQGFAIEKIGVKDNVSTTLNQYVKAKQIELGSNSTLNLAPDITVIGDIITSSLNNKSQVNIEGSATLIGTIGSENFPVSQVNFNSNNQSDIVTAPQSIYAKNITQGQLNLTLVQDTNFSVTNSYDTFNPTYSFGTQKLLLSGGGNLIDKSTFNLTISPSDYGRVAVDSGKLIVGAPNPKSGTLEPVKLVLNLTDTTTSAPINGQADFKIFDGINGGNIELPADSEVTFSVVSSSNPFVDWSYSNGVITQKTKPDVTPIIIDQGGGQISNPQDLQNLETIAKSPQSGAASDVISAIIDGSLQTTLDGLNTALTENSEIIAAQISDVLLDLSGNLGDISALTVSGAASGDRDSQKGMSAGENRSKYGVWSSFALGVNKQKADGIKPGYVARSRAGVIGIDTLISDETALGAAFTHLNGSIHHKNRNLGDRSSSRSNVFSIYSMTEMLNNWYVQGQAVALHTKISNSELRTTARGVQTARAKFGFWSYAMALESGYSIFLPENYVLTPLGGIEYNYISSIKYNETGTSTQNLSVNKDADHKLHVIGGLALEKAFTISEIKLIPEIYALMRQNVIARKSSIQARLADIPEPLVVGSARINRTLLNTGIGLSAFHNAYSVTLGYDYYTGKRYTSHQGTIKARVNL